jgi:hypothetical protein
MLNKPSSSSALRLSGLECLPVAKMKSKTIMRRTYILLAAFLFATILSTAQNQDFSKVQMKVTKVSGNVYMLEAPAEISELRSATTAS